MMKTRIKFILAGLFLILFIVTIILVKSVDVAQIAGDGSAVGMSGVNHAVNEFFGENMWLYTVTQWIGYAAIACACGFALLGVIQLIKQKSLRKVDREILALGVLYFVTFALYIFFEIVVVNRRPILMDGKTVAASSFPSSHSMIVTVILGSAIPMIWKYVNSIIACEALTVACVSVISFTISGRLVSGVHWLTDILGGVFISACLLCLFFGALDLIGRKNGAKDTE